MLKKLMIAAVAVVLGLTVVTSPTWVGSLLRTKCKGFQTWARNQVSPETEIQRLRDEVARLGHVSKKHFGDLAEETVAVENLRKEVTTLEANLEQQKRKVLTLKGALTSPEEFVTFGGEHRYSKGQVKTELTHSFEAYKAAEENLNAKRSLLQAKEDGLNSAREQLKAMQDARQLLEDKLAKMEAEIKKVRVAQTKSQFTFDDSELSRVKEDVANLETRINVEKKKLELMAEDIHDPIPTAEAVTDKDLVKDIDEHFKTGKEKVATQQK